MVDKRILFSEEDLRNAFEAGYDSPKTVWQAEHRSRVFNDWYTEYTKPPITEEPPVGTVLEGKGGYIWKHARPAGWYCVGKVEAYTWQEAYEMGADPNRPLVEIPRPNEGEYIITNKPEKCL